MMIGAFWEWGKGGDGVEVGDLWGGGGWGII